MVDVTSIPGLEGLIDTEARPGPEEIREVLRRHARFLLVVRVEYLGDRGIVYMGQRDAVINSRVNLGLVDLEAGRPVGRPKIVNLEYTPLNAKRVVSDKLRRHATSFLQLLQRD